jgi:hypothetical protein
VNTYRLELPSTVRLHLGFHLENLRQCPTATLRLFDPVTTHEDEDDEYDHDRISVVKIDIVLERRG